MAVHAGRGLPGREGDLLSKRAEERRGGASLETKSLSDMGLIEKNVPVPKRAVGDRKGGEGSKRKEHFTMSRDTQTHTHTHLSFLVSFNFVLYRLGLELLSQCKILLEKTREPLYVCMYARMG